MALQEGELRQAILAQLRAHTVLTLATAGKARPHAVSLMYAHEAFDIYWLSDPKTRHSQHLASSPLAAVTIAAQYDDFGKIGGLQIECNVRRLPEADEVAAKFDLLVARYPFLKKFSSGNLALRLDAAAIYRFRPAKVTLIDNSRGFGFKQILELTDRSGEAADPD